MKQMTTITTTNASAVTRKLIAMGFEKYDSKSQMGFEVMTTGAGYIHVANHTLKTDFIDFPGTAGEALEEAGYIIEAHQRRDWSQFLGRQVEVFHVVGRVAA